MTDFTDPAERAAAHADITAADHERIERSLTNRPPIDPNIIIFFELIREPFKDAAHLVIDLIPPSRERSLALTGIEEALMWAVKAIALKQEHTLDRAADADAANGTAWSTKRGR
jgi:hypothetical protein